MTRNFNTPPLPMEAITLHPRHHVAALWWLGCLYRNPIAFRDSLTQLSTLPTIRTTGLLFLHAMPWLLPITITGMVFLAQPVLVSPPWLNLFFPRVWFSALAEGSIILVVILFTCIGCGVGIGRLRGGSILALLGCMAVGLFSLGYLAFVIITGFVTEDVLSLQRSASLPHAEIKSGIASLAVLYAFFAHSIPLTFAFVSSVVFGGFFLNFAAFNDGVLRVSLIVAFVIVMLAVVGTVVHAYFDLNWGLDVLNVALILAPFAVMILGLCRCYYWCAHACFLLVRHRPQWYRFHPVAWDWLCWTPFPWFDRLLVTYAELDLARMEPEIQRLIREVPGQRSAVLRAFTILLARKACRVSALRQLSELMADLPQGSKGYLAETRRVRELAETIVRQQLSVDTTRRAHFLEIQTRGLVAEIRHFQAGISGMNEPLATEFRKASDNWLELAKAQVAKAGESTRAERAPQVFRAGDPVAGEKEAFVPRFRVLEELEGQLLMGSGCPGVLLRAPRRMGKSSLLKNISTFLTSDVTVVVMSLQSAKLFSSTGHFVAGLAHAVGSSLPATSELDSLRKGLHSNPPADLAGFLSFLSDCNVALERAGLRLLLALDEYEMLDNKLREGVFTLDLLATLRESIQSHRRIIWAFSGNADITELTGADWTSYLISVRTLEVHLFTKEETQLLLTNPLKHSALPYEDKEKSTLFWREFWGEEGIARIHAESGGWPYFVQLIAETAVVLANELEPGLRTLPSSLLETVLDESVSRGRNAFHQLLRSQCLEGSGEWEYLGEFARRDTQPPPATTELRGLLKRRQLLTEMPNGEWRLIVPLMSRWLQKES